jgi:hypothetical protein
MGSCCMTKHEMIDEIMGIKATLSERWEDYPGCERRLLEHLSLDTVTGILALHRQDLDKPHRQTGRPKKGAYVSVLQPSKRGVGR